MPSATPYAAIKNKLAADFAPGVPVLDDEQVDATIENSDQPFIGVANAFSEETTESVGSPQANWLRETGSIEVTVYNPSTDSLQNIRTLIETVRDAIRYQILDEGGQKVRVLNVQPPEVGEANDGLWSSMFVLVNYEWDYLRATA